MIIWSHAFFVFGRFYFHMRNWLNYFFCIYCSQGNTQCNNILYWLLSTIILHISNNAQKKIIWIVMFNQMRVARKLPFIDIWYKIHILLNIRIIQTIKYQISQRYIYIIYFQTMISITILNKNQTSFHVRMKQ